MECFPPSAHWKPALGKDDCWFYYGVDVVNTSIASYILAKAKVVDMQSWTLARLPAYHTRDYYVVLPTTGYDACHSDATNRRQNTASIVSD